MSETIDNMRVFHNFIKTELINLTKKNGGTTLLDIAVGRGGDLMKWYHSNFKTVIGFDPHSASIEEARRRLKEDLKTKKWIPFTKYFTLDALDPNILFKLNKLELNVKGLETNTYDVVSCQFAFHYFSNSLEKVLSFVSQKLKVGGIFIGTASDGDIIHDLLQNGSINTDVLKIEKVDEEKYTFNITSNSQNTYFDVQGVSHEFFLYKEKLITVAKTYNLHVLDIKSFKDWYSLYNKPMTQNECFISFLNFSLAFLKFP